MNSTRDKSRNAAEDGSMNGSSIKLYIHARVTDFFLSIFFVRSTYLVKHDIKKPASLL